MLRANDFKDDIHSLVAVAAVEAPEVEAPEVEIDIYVLSEYLEGLELLTCCAVCIGWRSRLLREWTMWRRRLHEDYGGMKRVKTTRNNVEVFSWRETYLMKVNEEARSERKCYYLFYFNMFHSWYEERLDRRCSEFRREHLHAFCKKRRGERFMKPAVQHYLQIDGGTYDDDAWQGQERERVQFASFREQFQVRKGKKVPVDIGGIMVRY